MNMNRSERRQKMKKQKPILRNNVMKLSKKNMNTFSEKLNDVFGILNKLTDSTVFQSSVFDWDGEDMIYIQVCGRDSVWTDTLECIDRGMCGDNDFIPVLKGIEPQMISPLYGHLLPDSVLQYDIGSTSKTLSVPSDKTKLDLSDEIELMESFGN